jgi:hypothetical protein
MLTRLKGFTYLFLLVLLSACASGDDPQSLPRIFNLLPSSQTGINFNNELTYTEEYNPYTFRNFFNGGGVGVGDINNDGLLDVLFCGNLVDNKLYLNKGNFEFEDITEKAGVAAPGVWTSGVSFVDINGDGWLDIYICKSGKPGGDNRHNELFINNKDLTFTEQSEAYGLNDLGLSTHAAFFDYDKDGDLDCYLLNNSLRSVGGYDLIKDQRNIRDTLGGNKLYRNDDNFFTDVSEAAGIYGSSIGFGLGVTIGDVNRDGWPDIFVSNDFFEKDYLYINNQDGTFSESLEEQISEISMSSMGADMADINNDGYPEIFVTDMLPEREDRIKTKTTFENWDKYRLNVENGYHHQFTRNVLQLNNGDDTFSEISRFAGVSATDWSWGALIFDLDNDGYKDIFVANGIAKDLTDQDYISYYSDPSIIRGMIKEGEDVITKLIDAMPSELLANYAFVNQQNLTFTNQSDALGLGTLSHSNGSAYADLDNDGDLDLLVNNINQEAFVYENKADTKLKNNYLVVDLKGKGANTFALGTQVTLYAEGQTYYQELAPMRGFESSTDYRLHFGLGAITKIDSVIVLWPDLKRSKLAQVEVNQFLEVEQIEAQDFDFQPTNDPQLFTALGDLNPEYAVHKENRFDDFDRDQLIFKMLSTDGPKITLGDVNADGLQDMYLCGAKGQAGQLLLQSENGAFEPGNNTAFEADKEFEDTDCLFFDADQDGDLDLFIASGGNEFAGNSPMLKDRLYFNNGQGVFEASSQSFPIQSTACLAVADMDADGDLDLFTGTRLKPYLYGFPANGSIFMNDGEGTFIDVSKEKAPDLEKIGMITDAEWLDYDQDNDIDLVLTGEWMPIIIFENEAGNFKPKSKTVGFDQSNGFWTCLEAADIDLDGDLDLVLGNQGLNSRIKASAEEPAMLYINDFDRNGMFEQILCTYNEGKAYPFVLRHDLVSQLPGLKKKYLKYESYKYQTVEDLFTPEVAARSQKLYAFNMESSIAINQGDGTYKLEALPKEAQFSSIHGILVEDFDKDGQPDLLLGGNFYSIKPELGINDGSYGQLLKGIGGGQFEAIPQRESGFKVKGQIRDFALLDNGKNILVAINNDKVKIFKY